MIENQQPHFDISDDQKTILINRISTPIIRGAQKACVQNEQNMKSRYQLNASTLAEQTGPSLEDYQEMLYQKDCLCDFYFEFFQEEKRIKNPEPGKNPRRFRFFSPAARRVFFTS